MRLVSKFLFLSSIFTVSAANAAPADVQGVLAHDSSDTYYGAEGRNVWIESGPSDMAYVYDYPYDGPFIGSIGAGERLLVYYHRDPSDVGASGRFTRVSVFYRVDGGSIQQIDASMPDSPGESPQANIDIPSDARGSLEAWFEVETDAGQRRWDSNSGRNFHVNILPAGCASITFAAPQNGAWATPTVEDQPLRAGDSLCVRYELDRIKALGVAAGSYRGATVEPSVDGWALFRDGEGREVARYRFHRARNDLQIIEVPLSARRVELWFKGYNYYAGSDGYEKWDNNFQRNFEFGVAP